MLRLIVSLIPDDPEGHDFYTEGTERKDNPPPAENPILAAPMKYSVPQVTLILSLTSSAYAMSCEAGQYFRPWGFLVRYGRLLTSMVFLLPILWLLLAKQNCHSCFTK